MVSKRILVVDDERVTREGVRMMLEGEGYGVLVAGSGEDALDLIQKRGLPHLALVDIEMPRMDGFELSRKILRFSDLPIILLTGVSDEGAVVTGLREVAEDYVTKPFRRAELLARVERVLRRMGDFGYTAEPDIEIDERLVVSLASRVAVLDGETIKLTPTEAKLLYILLKFAGRTVQTEYLLRRIWPLEEAFEDRLHAVVYRLRKKLEENPKEPRYIVADWSRGYVLPISA